MFKKIVILSVLLLSLVACSKKEEAKKISPDIEILAPEEGDGGNIEDIITTSATEEVGEDTGNEGSDIENAIKTTGIHSKSTN